MGYYEHVRKDLEKKGTKAGCDQVLPRSTFSQNLGDLIMKYALPGGVRAEEEEGAAGGVRPAAIRALSRQVIRDL